jgi:uncharacterized Ntn-hydrolase superfamily protein
MFARGPPQRKPRLRRQATDSSPMTYSIIAHDSHAGLLGGAVQSFYFSVGTQVLWAKPGAGVVITQMMAEPSYGSHGLELMERGQSPGAVLNALLASDSAADERQVAMINGAGEVAVHTGKRCIDFSGHQTGRGVSAQGAMLSEDAGWDAMMDAFQAADGELAERMLAALEAAEGHGGDVRGRKSAALVVVRTTPSLTPWLDRLLDLRVDDHPEPLRELRRLLALRRLYDRANRAFNCALAGDMSAALSEFANLEHERPDDADVAFRHGLLLALAGRVDDARRRLEQCYQKGPGWREALRRLPAAGYLPDDQELLERLGA